MPTNFQFIVHQVLPALFIAALRSFGQSDPLHEPAEWAYWVMVLTFGAIVLGITALFAIYGTSIFLMAIAGLYALDFIRLASMYLPSERTPRND